MSQLSCFLEMLVQLRSRLSGWRRIIPLSISGVTEVQRLRSMVVQSRLSQHLRTRTKRVGEDRGRGWSGVGAADAVALFAFYHLFHVLQIRMQTHSSWCVRCRKIFIQTSRWMA